MPEKLPEFVKSVYFVDEPGNWHLKPGAPEELKREFKHFLDSLCNIQDEPGTVDSIHVSYPYKE
ncbi:hypothetical protein [uncultured Metabacillus sp.]|uniref:hypothetical protein n=1 Tax=uncultured Metabacillus sp. TaxID=2860135 RepID=UPI0026201530|nr:hypothetical protein [uncultured Metabacillus sp.]